MKECDILGGGVIYSGDSSYIFSGGQDPNPKIYAPAANIGRRLSIRADVHQRSCSTLNPVSSGMGDSVRAGKPATQANSAWPSLRW